MIEWIKYDRHSREIESHVNHLVTNGQVVLIAQHMHLGPNLCYGWKCNESLLGWVTHWAKINLPVEGTSKQSCPYCGATAIHYCRGAGGTVVGNIYDNPELLST
ncbi:hypothetical protein E0485_15090 [Paenibacillus albiflavus]|uniref:Uncharacterized protein n=1 Tax=Paenibacillus albiflavus TaxID=2545760 RepID=A0A4R4EDC2_9BACL|nr:hypothetical protein [Paenibacillus albiflavus]TCZ76161.1 hypothetical protein E0485_15090 [Paenibacillus albiflavus]